MIWESRGGNVRESLGKQERLWPQVTRRTGVRGNRVSRSEACQRSTEFQIGSIKKEWHCPVPSRYPQIPEGYPQLIGNKRHLSIYVFILRSCAGYALSTSHKLEQSGEKLLNWENASIRLACRQAFGAFLVDMRRPRTLLPLGRCYWVIQDSRRSKPQEQASKQDSVSASRFLSCLSLWIVTGMYMPTTSISPSWYFISQKKSKLRHKNCTRNEHIAVTDLCYYGRILKGVWNIRLKSHGMSVQDFMGCCGNLKIMLRKCRWWRTGLWSFRGSFENPSNSQSIGLFL